MVDVSGSVQWNGAVKGKRTAILLDDEDDEL